ncbi:metallophosphoesterase [Corynebacterium halotolerans]|uniref:Phosphohydrolase n=1 Tax=Corynebacterium halotolerans YIM 70093 = DSM 44683 TaxID=1121362 RepID=M1NI67_9CORY|nr:metallophosphoesterase [Corynebacterium halotolerans]AGF71093.1 phosphohydrolase [Corynebacterium halotolerans YIM 70093 = DSM 44683]
MSNPRFHRAALAAGLATATLLTPVAHAAPVDFAPRPADTSATDDVIARESFDGLATQLKQRVNDPSIDDGTVGFTRTAPEGWTVENDLSMAGVGAEEWRGWSFTTRDFWVDAEDQMRDRFSRAQGVIAVADSDEFHDHHPGAHDFTTTLTSDEVPVGGLDAVELSFDSHYRGWAGQSATVTISFDGGAPQEVVRYDSTTVTDDYDGRVISANETHRIEVPAGAKNAVFNWSFQADENSWYWAIDSVAVRAAQPEADVPATSAWVVSDIQGDPDDLSHGLADLHTVRPDASGLITVGDIVPNGTEDEWADIHAVMEERQEILPELVATIGNHESYSDAPWEVHKDRFLEFADREQVWGEYVLEGAGVDIPVLVLGQEEQRPPEVPMSEEQLTWLDERLDHWTAQGRQVLVASHFPLGNTTGGTWMPQYSEHYEHNDLLTRMLSDHPNAIMLSGHTHYPVENGDWAVQRRSATGHPDGFWAVNTASMQVEWDARGENTADATEIVTRDINRGLTVDAYEDRMVITARDFGTVAEDGADNTINEEIRSITIPNPLYDADGGHDREGDRPSGGSSLLGSSASSLGSSIG